jgi:type VI secretion system Hcp family effector
MAFNAYLVFGVGDNTQKIGGESSSDVVKSLWKDDQASNTGAVEVTDFGFGVSMPVTTSRSDGGGATVGRANFDVFTCSKNIDTATTSLVDYCCKGTAIKRIVLHLYRQGEGSDTAGVVKYAMVVFGSCVITKVGISGGGEELPKESLEFNYGACEYIYQLTDHDTGKAIGNKPTARKGWSLVQNRSVTSGQDFDKIEPQADKTWS